MDSSPHDITMPAATLAPSAVRRRLALRRRCDLVISPQVLRGEMVWAVKDPVALHYFHLRDVEHWVYRQLDGTVSLADVQERFAEQFAPRRLPLAELQSFLATLHRSGLIVADAPGQGDELLRRSRQRRRATLWQTLTNPLAIRFRGFDPERLLGFLSRSCGWLFSRWFLAASAALVVAALLLVALRLEQLWARLPERDAFFSPHNLMWLGIALAGVKLLHELGHALTCRHFGGECHEMGVMLLVFTPCLYCNVSDAWMLPSRWQRAAVGAAGIVVEVVLAALCTFLWWFSQPGLFNALCLNVMVICSVSTLVINGNPLLRYDGYYVLADLAETPNLAQQSAAILRQALARWVLGISLPADGEPIATGRRVLMGAYAAASTVYRAFVLFGVLWFVYKTLQPHRLEVVAEVLALAVAGGFILAPLIRLARFLTHPYWRRQVQSRRATLISLAIVAAAGALLAIPWPHHVAAPAVLQPADARRVYAAVSGRLVEGVAEGALVEQGDAIAVLENTDLALEIEKLRGQRDQQRLRVENLKRRQVQEHAAAAQLPPALELLADLEQRLTQRLLDEARLTIAAPAAGTVLPPRRHEPRPPTGALPTWSGTPLDPQNRGCTLETGTLICRIGDPARLEAILTIDQADVEFVAAGQAVQIQLEQSPGTILVGTITELAEIDLDVTPPELFAQVALPTRPDSQGIPRPLSTSYQARVRLDATRHPLLLSESGRAKISAAKLSLGRRLLRAFGQTFGIDLRTD